MQKTTEFKSNKAEEEILMEILGIWIESWENGEMQVIRKGKRKNQKEPASSQG